MTSPRYLAFVGALLFCFSGFLRADLRSWPHETSSLELDSSVVCRNLSNGFRYALMPHVATPGRISMRFVVSVGSVDELEDERGLSHFVEHMAFAGTKRYPSGEMGRFFQTLGMDFGGDVTAFTYHDKTVYHLELPNNDPELIAQSIELYRDFADGILFDPERIDIEREVILREKQARDTPQSRLAESSMEFAMKGFLAEGKQPIGSLDVIENSERKELLEFYRKWYRPDLMTLVVVGDFETEAMEEVITNQFASLPLPDTKLKARDWGTVKDKKAEKALFYEMNGMERYHVEALRSWSEKGADSWKKRERDFLREFATELFNERCRLEIDEIRDDFASYGRFLNLPQVSVTISVGGTSWMNGVVWVDRRIRQVVKYGFSDDEVERLKSSWERNNRNTVVRYQSLESNEIIDDLVDSFEEGYVYLGIEEACAFRDRMLERVNAKSVREAFRDSWDLDRIKYFIAGEGLNGDLDDGFAKVLKADRKLKLPKYEMVAHTQMEFSELGLLGEVESEDPVDGIGGACSITFSNNLHLTFMKTDYQPGGAHVLVRVGGGMLELESGNPATHEIGLNAFFRTGFAGHSMEAVYSNVRENLDTFSFSVAEHDAFEFRSSGDEEGLMFFFRMLTEYLRDPQISEEAFTSAKTKYRQMRLLEPDGVNEGYRSLRKLLFQGATQFHEPTLEEIEQASIEEAKEWLLESFREGFLEVVVVGDLEKDFVADMIGGTLGTLPEHKADKSEYDLARKLKMDIPAGLHRIEYEEGKGENAYAVVAWSVTDESIDFRESACLFVFSQILENRFHEQVRQELGKSYSPMVNYEVYPAYDAVRLFRADVDCLREDADAVLQLAHVITNEVLEAGLDKEEVARAVIPLEDRIVGAWRDNDFLTNMVFSGMYEYEDSIRYALAYRDGLLSELSADEILTAARKYLKADCRLSVSITPGSSNPVPNSPSDYGDSSRTGISY
ncbi:insulinase family protein [Puniceicoccaceae bacterium K14]|nr:insulinase family protein [Puniceicoccaceae bacterium K14]